MNEIEKMYKENNYKFKMRVNKKPAYKECEDIEKALAEEAKRTEDFLASIKDRKMISSVIS